MIEKAKRELSQREDRRNARLLKDFPWLWAIQHFWDFDSGPFHRQKLRVLLVDETTLPQLYEWLQVYTIMDCPESWMAWVYSTGKTYQSVSPLERGEELRNDFLDDVSCLVTRHSILIPQESASGEEINIYRFPRNPKTRGAIVHKLLKELVG